MDIERTVAAIYTRQFSPKVQFSNRKVRTLFFDGARFVQGLFVVLYGTGDRVRILIKQTDFQKKSVGRYSNEVYTIIEKQGLGYKLRWYRP
jgi:hypothetical protein